MGRGGERRGSIWGEGVNKGAVFPGGGEQRGGIGGL